MAREMPYVEAYTFESETQLFSIPVNSDLGTSYRVLSSTNEKQEYLKLNGELTTKETGGRIMIPQHGVWYHRNVGQMEYMIPVESELGEQYGMITDMEEKKEFWEENVVRIREWPERISRSQTF